MSVYDFLRTIAAQLGDDRPGAPFRRYPLSLLAAFYSEAMCFVATNRPDLFTKFIVMKLGPGTLQDARCCGCDNIIGFMSQVNEDGSVIKDLTDLGATGTTDRSKWHRAMCATSSSGSGSSPTTFVESITIEPGMNGVFTVKPPIPVGVNVWVTLKCVTSPCPISEAEVLNGASTGDCKFLPAVRSYILYRALQGDRHAVGASTDAQTELKNVYAYLNMQMKAEKAQEEE